MEFRSYQPEEVEEAIRNFWKEIKVTQLYNKNEKPFYFLDGPPYTSGQVHIGTALNKCMKDALVRYKRMKGYNVRNTAGFDMHGLPNEHATMKELGLANNQEIHEYGLEKFMKACKKRATTNMQSMIEEFRNMGVSLDFENAYQTMSDEWIESVWWFIKQAHEKDRLYEANRPMAWDPVSESACAKHELEYKSVQDTSIYVKFNIKNTSEYLIVWTTTPWTIPFNLMIMVNPELTYQKIEVGDETWIIAKELAKGVLEKAGVQGTVTKEIQGDELLGVEYEHFLEGELDYKSIKQNHPNTHTVVASTEYVTTQAGSGLVHAAPGCGPEDYEVGVEYDIPAWNLLDATGTYPPQTGRFGNLHAKKDEKEFVNAIDEHNALVAEEQYVHDYPHAERTKAPVVYKATKQWFLRVDDLKEQMIAENDEVQWMPESGYNAFNNWLENLRDNSISKQRFWGTPLPIWRSEDGDIIVIENKKELEELSGSKIEDMHKPWIDNITIDKDGKTYTRIPDVVDVWIDSGVAHFAALKYPASKDEFNTYWPADFIIEGNDQVRGWFNLLMVTGILAFGEAPFKSVYMHGMINDVTGRKMSKSVGNYIRPEEIINKYGADASRLYLIGHSRAGQDLNYNHADCENKHKQLLVYWNIHNYLKELIETKGLTPQDIKTSQRGIEEQYIISKTHNTLQEVQQVMGDYRIERLPQLAEALLDEISRTYIQLIRSKAHTGDKTTQQAVINALSFSYLTAVRLLAPVTPFITEAIWQNLRELTGQTEKSIHATHIPTPDKEYIHADTELHMKQAQQIISTILSARDSAQIGVRWPLQQAVIKGVDPAPEEYQKLIKEQTNVKELVFSDELDLRAKVAPNYRRIGKKYGEKTADIAQKILDNPISLGEEFSEKETILVAGEELAEEYLEIEYIAPKDSIHATDETVHVLLHTQQDEELLKEGYYRELVRRVQQKRKEADMEKTDTIHVVLSEDLVDILDEKEVDFLNHVGATSMEFGDYTTLPHTSKQTIKGREIVFGIRLVDE